MYTTIPDFSFIYTILFNFIALQDDVHKEDFEIASQIADGTKNFKF